MNELQNWFVELNTTPIGDGSWTRASLMLNVVFVAMVAVLPIQVASVYLAKYTGNFQLHRKIQIATAAVLGITLVAFEVDLQMFTDWRALAEPSRLYDSGWVDRLLWIHLLFAIPTPFVWLAVIFAAWWKFGSKLPGKHSNWHRVSGRWAAGLLAMTTLTGWAFYIAAFVY